MDSPQALVSLARIDSDAVWSVLVEVADSDPADRYEPHNPDPTLFPPFSAIAPPRMKLPVGASASAGRAARARVLLEQVKGLPARWHAEVAALAQQGAAYASALSNPDDPFSLPDDIVTKPDDTLSFPEGGVRNPVDPPSLPEGVL